MAMAIRALKNLKSKFSWLLLQILLELVDEVLCERRGAIINRFHAKFQMESAARFGAKTVTIECDYFRESIGITSASASERVNFCKL